MPWKGKSSKVTIGFSPVWQRSNPPHPHICSYMGSKPPRILSSPGLGLEPGLSHLNHPFSTVQKPEEIWKGNHVLCLGKGLGKWTPGRLSHENKRITIIWWRRAHWDPPRGFAKCIMQRRRQFSWKKCLFSWIEQRGLNVKGKGWRITVFSAGISSLPGFLDSQVWTWEGGREHCLRLVSWDRCIFLFFKSCWVFSF